MRGSARGLRAGAGDVNSLVNNSRVSLNQQCNPNAPQRIVETILRELCGEHGRLGKTGMKRIGRRNKKN